MPSSWACSEKNAVYMPTTTSMYAVYRPGYPHAQPVDSRYYCCSGTIPVGHRDSTPVQLHAQYPHTHAYDVACSSRLSYECTSKTIGGKVHTTPSAIS